MSIQSEIDRIENNIAATYAELEEQGADMPSARNSTNLAATAATTKTVKYIAQTLTAAQKKQARENIGVYAANVKDYGAKGNNSTDDTTAFRNALAANRVVYVPGGKYKISEELVIGYNSQLELAQDAVLYFTNTSGNCITLKSSAFIKGNHATVSVPYGFTGHVINIDTGLTETAAALRTIPPYTHWDPVWKHSVYITDLNIVKPNPNGLHYSSDGVCSGTAVYINTDGNDPLTFLWGIDLSRLRIAGAFTYGVYGEVSNMSGDSGWNHDMRIDGFISGCETGVKMVRVNKVYLSTMIQPQAAVNGTPYAKCGIYLENSKYANLINARVFDWNSEYTTWFEGSENQHLVMIGECKGAILEDWFYYAQPNYDIRSLIYTDTPSNLENLTILQEPFTRWFKPIDHVPYFNDGDFEEKLVLQQELDEIVDAERTANFTNVLPSAIDTDGSVFNGKGFIKSGGRLVLSSGKHVDTPNYGYTGFIPVTAGSVIYTQALKIDTTDGYAGAIIYDANKSRLAASTGLQFATNAVSYNFHYEELEKGFSLEVKKPNSGVYIRFVFKRADIGVNPIVSVGNPITYTQTGRITDGITIKAANVEGLSEILGSYIDDVDALLGGS